MTISLMYTFLISLNKLYLTQKEVIYLPAAEWQPYILVPARAQEEELLQKQQQFF